MAWGGHGAGSPVRVPVAWTCCLSAQHSGGLLPSLVRVSPPFPHPWIRNRITVGVPGSPGAGPHHGVTPFPSALLQPELGRGSLGIPQQPKGFMLGGLQLQCFGDRTKAWLLTLHQALFSRASPRGADRSLLPTPLRGARPMGGTGPHPGSPVPTSPSQEGAWLLSNCLASPPASSSI